MDGYILRFFLVLMCILSGVHQQVCGQMQKLCTQENPAAIKDPPKDIISLHEYCYTSFNGATLAYGTKISSPQSSGSYKVQKEKTISDTRTTGTDKQLIAKYNGFPFGTPTSSHQSPHHAQYQCGEGLDFAVIKDCQKHVFTELRNISKGPTMHPVKYMQ